MPLKTINFIDDHSLEAGFRAQSKKFSQIGSYVIPIDSSRRAESIGTTFSPIREGRFFSILRKFFNFLYLENFWSKSRPPRIRLKVVPFDAARRDESIGITYDPIRENFLLCVRNPASRLWSSMKLIVFNGVHARNKKFSRIGSKVIPFDSARQAESIGTTFSLIREGRFFSILRKIFNFLYLENFRSKSRPSRIGAYYTPFDAARRDKSNGITYDPIWENFLLCAWMPLKTINFIDDHSLEAGFRAQSKKFSQIGAYVIPFDLSRRAESIGTIFSKIRGGRFFSKIFQV